MQTSRLEAWKGQSLLIAALGRLRDRSGWVAWIAGGAQRPHEQEYLARLAADSEAAGISDRVRFLGQRSDVAELLAAADVHCQPNLWPEPFGIAFVEALYAGLPVVSARGGGGRRRSSPRRAAFSFRRPIRPPWPRPWLPDRDPARRFSSAPPAHRAARVCDPGVALGRLGDLLIPCLAPPMTDRQIGPPLGPWHLMTGEYPPSRGA